MTRPTRTRLEWAKQAHAALDKITAANGGIEPATMHGYANADPRAFALLTQAMTALGHPVPRDLITPGRGQ